MFKYSALAVALGMALASAAYATDNDTTPPPATTGATAGREKAQDLDTVSVIGSGETRQVQRLRTTDQKALPPGTSL